jgi:hypothetical protein
MDQVACEIRPETFDGFAITSKKQGTVKNSRDQPWISSKLPTCIVNHRLFDEFLYDLIVVGDTDLLHRASSSSFLGEDS